MSTFIPLSSLPPQIAQQLQPGVNLQSQASGMQTAEQTAQQSALNTQYLQAPQNLRTDLQNGMTLGDAMKKYTALKMTPDDIFSQYLNENTWGPNKSPKLPVETLNQLRGLGLTEKSLGQIGDQGSFADKWNTKNAIEELRTAKNYFMQTKAADIAGNLAGINSNSKAYENARLIVGEHLSSLIPGASSAQGTGNALINTLPSSNDLRSYTPDMINKAFDSVEKTLLASRGYDYSTLGLTSPQDNSSSEQQTNKPKSGGELLNNILKNSASDLEGIKSLQNTTSPLGLAIDPNARNILENAVLHPINTGENMISGLLNAIGIKSDVSQAGMNVQPPKSPQELIGNILNNAQEHPVNTALTVLGPLLGLGGRGSIEPEGAVGETAANTTAEALAREPGGLSKIFNPSGAKQTVGNIRDTIVSGADKVKGNVVSGDQVASLIRNWADEAKLSNLPDADAIEQAAVNAEKMYAGKTFKPSQLKNIYDNIEKGYTANGQPRSATASYIDRGIQGILSNQLEQMAPGWNKANQMFSSIYNTEKGAIAKTVKNLPQNAAKTALNISGLGVLGKLFGL